MLQSTGSQRVRTERLNWARRHGLQWEATVPEITDVPGTFFFFLQFLFSVLTPLGFDSAGICWRREEHKLRRKDELVGEWEETYRVPTHVVQV